MKLFNSKIKGHDGVQNQLSQALTKKRLAHALLLAGPSGIGKKELAWSLAQKLLCESSVLPSEGDNLSLLGSLSPQESLSQESSESCGDCFSCRQVLKRQCESVLEITHETLQIRLQDVQTIPPFLSLQSFSKAQIVLIDELEKLNLQASNFLLKIIEEPPPKSHFFFISSNPAQISLTLRSRLQMIRMKALSEKLMREFDGESPDWMIRGSKGRFDKLKELKEKASVREKAFELFKKLFEEAGFIDFSQYVKARAVALDFVNFFQQFFRDLRILKAGLSAHLSLYDHLTHGDKKKEYQKWVFYPKEFIDEWMKHTVEMEQELKANFDTVLCFENLNIKVKKGMRDFKLFTKDKV